MKKFSFLFSIIVCIALLSEVKANNVQIANTTLAGQNLAGPYASHYTMAQFDISWENSWRIGSGPKNWDAVWVFVKYQVFGQEWKHATLSTNPGDHNISNNSGVAATFLPSSDGKGAMIYRSAVGGTGNINWIGTSLKWNYPSDGVADAAQVTIKVFAIEMVDIPTGPFFMGDGTVGNNSFRDGLGYPFMVSSESGINFQATSGSSTSQPADPNWANGYSLSTSFPKGYQEFYVMKYELTQAQYQEFFNTLPNNKVLKDNKNITGAGYRNTLAWSGLANDGMTGGGERACNNLNYSDLCAYADWSGMRPMTELEYEKASRGCDNTGTPTPIFPVANEYAWGNTNAGNPKLTHNKDWWGFEWMAMCAGNLVNNYAYDNCVICCGTANGLTTGEGTSSETIKGGCTNSLVLSNPCYSCSFSWDVSAMNLVSNESNNSTYSGPVRVGIFAAKNCSNLQREKSGASYYGVMELSGNVAEIIIQTKRVYTSGGSPSLFAGTQGDGALSSAGYANISDWYDYGAYGGGQDVIPSMSYLPCGLRGGGFSDAASVCRTSDRSQINTGQTPAGTSRSVTYGGRLVRIP